MGVDTDAKASLNKYIDSADVTDWAVKYMKWAVSTGIYNGVDGELAPKASVKRYMAAEILYAFLNGMAD